MRYTVAQIEMQKQANIEIENDEICTVHGGIDRHVQKQANIEIENDEIHGQIERYQQKNRNIFIENDEIHGQIGRVLVGRNIKLGKVMRYKVIK